MSNLNHYEIVILVHPDYSDQVQNAIKHVKAAVTDSNGTIHREEEWGRKQLTYAINKLHKAHFIMFNIECDVENLLKLEEFFKYNDKIIRTLILNLDKAVSEKSYILNPTQETEEV